MPPHDENGRPVSDDESNTTVAPTKMDVGSEGGSPGDVDLVKNPGRGVGSEADETWRPADADSETIVRDETGVGRRSP